MDEPIPPYPPTTASALPSRHPDNFPALHRLSPRLPHALAGIPDAQRPIPNLSHRSFMASYCHPRVSPVPDLVLCELAGVYGSCDSDLVLCGTAIGQGLL
uniref:Uncharacterized protein n=1 Tax=Oryza sativa subsp. japonica TaxID=39947 RepID=Q6Z5I9_ORYSJ|nr:hypothetical protein [Oryza sativa Japonica Group]